MAATSAFILWEECGFSRGPNRIVGQADIRKSASVAHNYGQNLVAAESMTAFGLRENAWSYLPVKPKPTAHLAMTNVSPSKVKSGMLARTHHDEWALNFLSGAAADGARRNSLRVVPHR